MADAVWQSTNGDGSDAGSWSTGAVPGLGDRAIFNGASDRAWTTGMTLAGHPTLIVTRDNRARLGGPGNGVRLTGSDITRHHISGQGDVYIMDLFSLDIVIDMLGGKCVIGEGGGSECWVWRVFVKGGVVTFGPKFGSSSGGDPVDNSYIWVDGQRALVTIEATSGVNGHEALILHEGVVDSARDFEDARDRLLVYGGELNQRGLLKSNMEVYSAGGRLNYAPDSDPSAEGPYLKIDGVLDVSKSKYAIPVGQLVLGRRGQIIGSAIETSQSLYDLDLRQDIP